jgi:uncharacterized protein
LNIYLDASVAVSLITLESRTDTLRIWMSGIDPDTMFISPWVTAEVASALSIKVRTKAIDMLQRAQAQASWGKLCDAIFETVPVTAATFETAAQFCANPAINLRAPDALHLAIARHTSLTIATLDRDMLTAASQLGIAAFSPIEDNS